MGDRLRFVVRSPALMPPTGNTGPIPDPAAIHLPGEPMGGPTDLFKPHFGAAVVHGGHKVGDKWMGCSYTVGPWVIPGIGDVEPMP